MDTSGFQALTQFVDAERNTQHVFPPETDVFAAFRETPLESVRVLILGQDPYHDDGQAHGLSFSVPVGCRLPPSLRNIFKELSDDLATASPPHGDLTPWAHQGVLLLNSVLTVRAHTPASHAKHGWEAFTDSVIRVLAARSRPIVFVLWGAYAQRKRDAISAPHVALCGAHPSPLSAYRGFFGSRPFSAINSALQSFGSAAIEWSPTGQI